MNHPTRNPAIQLPAVTALGRSKPSESHLGQLLEDVEDAGAAPEVNCDTSSFQYRAPKEVCLQITSAGRNPDSE